MRAPSSTAGRVAAVAALVVVMVATGVAVAYRHQLVSYFTHLRGSPSSTEPWEPFPPGDDLELHLAAVGDIGEGGARVDATGAAVDELDHREPVDALLVLGDNAYPTGDPTELQRTLFEPFAAVLDDAELLAILGNHDVMKGHAAGQMEALGMPGRWWARHFDDVLVVGLDSNRPDDPDQLAWLDATLAAATERWRIVMLHHPPYSAGYQGSNDEVREAFVPLFEEHGVQLVLSGHDHDYQRSRVIDGVTYVVSGAASRTRRTGTADFTVVSFSWHSFVEIAVFPERMVVRAVNQDLRVGDEAVVQR